MRVLQMPIISVVIPCYNAEKYIAECLDSVLSQTFKDFEIICVDDGSTDNSATILAKYEKKDKRIKIITQKNRGVICARNDGVKQSQGEFLYFLDSDDIIDKTLLEKSYDAIVSGKGDIITCRVMTFGRENGEMLLPKPTKLNMSKGNCLVNAALLRRSLFNKSNGFDEAFQKGLEDYDFWLNMIYRQNAHFYRIPELLFYYRIKPIQESRNKQQMLSCNAELMDMLKIKYPEIQRYKRLNKIISNFFQIRVKPTKTIIRILKLPLLSIKCQSGKIVYALFGLIPIFAKRNTQIFCYYFDSVRNFGDLLNCDLFKYFGTDIKKANMPDSDIMAIGSLLQTLFTEKKLSLTRKISIKTKKPIIVYGSGFIEDTPKSFYPLRKLDIRAVRGFYSLEKLKQYKNIKIADNVAIGDPGLLSKYIVDTSKIKKKYDLGIIPHYVDKHNTLLKKIKVKNAVVIDIQQSPQTFLEQLAECKTVISSAMHGLIAADSLGIPNVRMVLSDKITGGDYKYNDYYSAFGLKEHNVVNLENETFTDKSVADITKNYKINPAQVEKICKDLMAVYPYREEK